MPIPRSCKSRRIVLRDNALFEALAAKGANTDGEIAALLGINRMSVLRVRLRQTRPGVTFIAGALNAVDLPFGELFEIQERE